MSFDVVAVRRQFPILVRDHRRPAGPLSRQRRLGADAACRARRRAHLRDDRPRQRAARRASPGRARDRGLRDRARAEVAKFLGVQPMEIVFTGGCTAAINLVAYSYGSLLKAGDRILLSELEHHSNIVPWQLLRQRSGIELDMIPVTVDGRIDLDAAAEARHAQDQADLARPRLQRHRRAARRAERWSRPPRSVGAKVMLDGAQRAPHGPLDLPALGIDFYVFAGHKAYGPNGVGVLWAQARAARRHAAVPWRWLDDRPRDLRRDDLGAAAAPLRGRHAADRAGDRPGRCLQVDARPRLDGGARSRDGAGAARDGRPAEDRRHAALRAGQPAEPLSRRVVPARGRASARRGADARFVRRGGAGRPSLRPAIDGPLRSRRHDARLDRALQRQQPTSTRC